MPGSSISRDPHALGAIATGMRNAPARQPRDPDAGSMEAADNAAAGRDRDDDSDPGGQR